MTVREAIKKYKTGSILSKKNEKRAQELVHSDEDVLWASDSLASFGIDQKEPRTFADYATTNSQYSGTTVITNKRILNCCNMSFGMTSRERQMAISDIQQLFFSTNTNMGCLMIRSYTDAIGLYDTAKKLQAGKEILEELVKQNKKETAQPIKNKSEVQGQADELLKWKDLLDQGIITQAEFDAKKRQLLGL